MTSVKTIVAAVAAAFSLSMTSSPFAQTETLGMEVFKNLTDVKDMVEVPDGPFHAVESEKGDILFVSASGRWVIGGLAFDIWAKKQLKNVNDMRHSFTHIDLKTMGVTPDAIGAVTLGKGSKEVVIFVDPNCTWCHKLIEEIQNDQALQADYRFKLLFIPALGKPSYEKVKAMYCATDTSDKTLLGAFNNRSELSLPQKQQCDTQLLDKRIMTAAAVGVQGVPFIIAHDGRFTRGKPQDLKAWLFEGERENELKAAQYREAIKRAAKRIMTEKGSLDGQAVSIPANPPAVKPQVATPARQESSPQKPIEIKIEPVKPDGVINIKVQPPASDKTESSTTATAASETDK